MGGSPSSIAAGSDQRESARCFGQGEETFVPRVTASAAHHHDRPRLGSAAPVLDTSPNGADPLSAEYESGETIPRPAGFDDRQIATPAPPASLRNSAVARHWQLH
jgi:hypothetical protein